MSRAKILVKLMIVSGMLCVCITASHGGHADQAAATDSDTGSVTMEITRLDANDSALTLCYNVRNGTNRDAWVCTSIGAARPLEVFLARDGKTLLIRKRLDLHGPIWERGAPVGTYVRVAPGDSLADAIQMILPVSPVFVFAGRGLTSVDVTARHLALEIGYYDEDLPALIHSIFAVADKSGLTVQDIPPNALETYFRGIRTRAVLGDFDVRNPDPYGQGRVSIDYSDQALTGEKILRVDANDVSIPFKGDW
jgi:hypothetical protein